jgi:cytosine/adenosine deaminase-related metal-dependent hydrolase
MTRKEFIRLSAGAAAMASVLSFAKETATPKTSGFSGVSTVKGKRPLLIRNANVVSMDPQLGEMRKTDVLVRDGRIAAIGSAITAPEGSEVIDATDMILMPGMIDNHRHVWESLEFGGNVRTEHKGMALYQHYKSLVMVCMTPEDFYLAELFGGLQALNSGVTTMVDYAHVHYTKERAVQGARGLIDSGISGIFCYQLGHNPTHKKGDVLSMKQSTAERVSPPTEENYKVAEYLKNNVFTTDCPVEFGLATSYGLDVRPMGEMKKEFDRARGLQPKLFCSHIHLAKPAPPEGIFRSVADLYRANLLGPDFHVEHGVEMTDDELKMLRDTGGIVSSSVLGEFTYPKPSIHVKARELGVVTGIGLDVPVSFSPDYFEIVRAANLVMYALPEYKQLGDRYDSTMVLDFATRIGAQAARCGDNRGTITVGKYADLILLRTDRMGFAMFGGTLADSVLHFANTADVDSVWVRGVAKKRNGKLLGVDWPKLRKAAMEAGTRIRKDYATIKLV